MRRNDILAAERQNRLFGPVRRAAIDMAREHPRPQRIARNRGGVLGLGSQVGQNLPAHPLHRIRIKARRGQRLLQ